MKKLMVVLMVAAFVATALVAVAQDKGPAVIKLTKKGTITFDHAKHQAATPDCATCHHTGGFEKCSSCHAKKADGKKLKYKKAMHNNCIGCHKDVKKGPTKCKQCHVK